MGTCIKKPCACTLRDVVNGASGERAGVCVQVRIIDTCAGGSGVPREALAAHTLGQAHPRAGARVQVRIKTRVQG